MILCFDVIILRRVNSIWKNIIMDSCFILFITKKEFCIPLNSFYDMLNIIKHSFSINNYMIEFNNNSIKKEFKWLYCTTKTNHWIPIIQKLFILKEYNKTNIILTELAENCMEYNVYKELFNIIPIEERNKFINYKDKIYGRTILHIAIYFSNIGCVKYLLENGANTEIYEDQYKQTSLLIAVQRSSLDIIKLLLEYNAKANSRDKHNLSIEHLSKYNINPQVNEFVNQILCQ